MATKIFSKLGVALLMFLGTACGGAAPSATAKSPAGGPKVEPPVAAAPNAALTRNKQDASVNTQGLHVSDEIARACNLPRTEVAPSFGFDSVAIADDDRTVLDALARCLSDGPLRGRRLQLTGRADARGEDEYNMSLGESRADAVRRYLHDLGVQLERVGATSRGELDATGADEDGWARDRRVDIDLAR